MLNRLYRCRRGILLPVAALPLLQVAGCPDFASLGIQAGTNLSLGVVQGIISSAAGTLLSLFLHTFAGSNFFQAFIGGS